MVVPQRLHGKELQMLLTYGKCGFLLCLVLGVLACGTKSPERRESSPHEVESDSVIRIDSSFMRKVTLTPTSQRTEIVDLENGQIRIPGRPYDTFGTLYHDSTMVCISKGSGNVPLIRYVRHAKELQYPRTYGDVVYWYHQIGPVVAIAVGRWIRFYDKAGRVFDSTSSVNTQVGKFSRVVTSIVEDNHVDVVTVDTINLSTSKKRWKLDHLDDYPTCIHDSTIFTSLQIEETTELRSITPSLVELGIGIHSVTYDATRNALSPEHLVVRLKVPSSVSYQTYKQQLLGVNDHRIVFVLCEDTDKPKITDYLVACERDASMARVYMIPSTMRRTLWKRAQYDNDMDMYISEWPSGVGYHVDDDLQSVVAAWPTRRGLSFRIIDVK